MFKKKLKGLVISLCSLLVLQSLTAGILPAASASDQIPGDPSGDGKINSLDYSLAKKYLLGLLELPESGLATIDLDGDGKFNSKDISLLKSYILCKIDKFPVNTTPSPSPTPTPTPTPASPQTGRQMESLDRGAVAVKVSNGVFVSWRILGTEFNGVNYNLYRDGTKVNSSPLTVSNYTDTSGTASSAYSISAIIDGVEQAKSASVNIMSSNYLSVPIVKPADMTMPDGSTCSYSANDCSTADLDGDHQYEIILKWDPSNAQDNSKSGYTGDVYIDAYKLNGKRLWRIDLGKNIRAGAHYTQFQAFDFDGDGKAEVACKTADGTVDGTGKVIGDASKDYRSSSGYVLSGPEYLTMFDGQTGAAVNTVNYDPPRGTVSSWGDNYGNRVDRFLACTAYLDGQHPSLVMCRGYYTRAVLAAYDYKNKKLTERWKFDSSDGNSKYEGQGDHNLSVNDVDGDGKDEITYGSCTIDDNGKGLYTTGFNHGDALHVSDLDPDIPGIEVWNVHEAPNPYVADLHDAKTGQLLWGITGSGDNGRGLAADIDASHTGCEVWSAATPMYDCKGTKISDTKPSTNFALWWDGDLQRELLDGNHIDKWVNGASKRVLTASECVSINGTKSNPCLSADLFGDWREEVVWATSDSSALHIYTTTDPTSVRLYTLMHDSTYRTSVAWQNTAYNQPPMTGFYLGGGMSAAPTPKIYYAP